MLHVRARTQEEAEAKGHAALKRRAKKELELKAELLKHFDSMTYERKRLIVELARVFTSELPF